MKWVTRERPKIDRIACPWLVVRFIDDNPEFLFVPTARVFATAAETGAIVVAEEHLVASGLGVRVAQVVSESKPCPMEYVGIQDTYAESGTPEELMDKYGLVARDVIAACRRVLARK